MAVLPAIGQGPRRLDVIQLLESVELPTADLTEEDMTDFFYAGELAAPVGIVGVQIFGTDALLRSLVVLETHRTQGLGKRLVERAERHARKRGAAAIYLLTTTAEFFFRSLDYVTTPRDSAPASIRSTPEFAGLCPATAVFLSKRL